MADFGDFIAQGVITQALVCEGDRTLEDLGIMSLEPGQVILKCSGARRIDPDDLHAVPCYTPNWIVRQNMLEYAEWMEKATALMRDMRDALIGYECWLCLEQPEKAEWMQFDERLREFGIGDDDDD